jgi:hypothetical protein
MEHANSTDMDAKMQRSISIKIYVFLGLKTRFDPLTPIKKMA